MTDYRAECAYIMNRLHGVFGLPEVIIPIDDGGPGPAPAPEMIGSPDSDGCTKLRSVEALIAAEGSAVVIPGVMEGEPAVAPVAIPTRFQTQDSVAALPEGEAKTIATLSLNAAAFHQNRCVKYYKGPWYKGGRWMEGDTVLGAVSYNGSAADLARMIVGRHRRIKAGTPGVLHFLALDAQDYAAGA